ncbi:hypothetical protein [Eikenella halliae]|jgi:hypothetical protein|uniref:hypothetical protein n=1 Tax=Eikenella halliae TaxID=1795832 RepID=UPI003610F174
MIEAMAVIAKFLWHLASIISSLLVLAAAGSLLAVTVMAWCSNDDDIFINREGK